MSHSAVTHHLLHFLGPDATLVSHPVGGQPAVLGLSVANYPACWHSPCAAR
jgi:hypothetical protein